MSSGATNTIVSCSRLVSLIMILLDLVVRGVCLLIIFTGRSSECKGCKGSDDQRHTRYKQIAELVKEVRGCGDEQPFSTPKSATFSRYDHALLGGSASKTSKKERKEAKRVAKAAERAPLITADDIERVAHILHPKEPVDEEFEKALLMDKSIENNIFYHPGTANSYEMRDRIIRQERSGRTKLKLSEKELDQILAELLPDLDRSKSKKERDLIARLRKMVEEDLTHDHGEEQQTMMRKASFWRWANREAYNRLAANGRIWDWKSGEALAPVVEQQADAADDEPDAEMLDTDDPGLEAPDDEASNEKDDTVVDEGKAGGDPHATDLLLRGLSLTSDDSRTRFSSSSSVSRNTSASSASRATGSSTDDSMDDFVRVGKDGKADKKRPLRISTAHTPILKFSANGGLGHISNRSTPRTPMTAFSMLPVEDAEDSGDDDEDHDGQVSPRTPCPKRRLR